jgi:hypothetical protein
VVKLIGKILAAIVLSMALMTSQATALPTADVTDQLSNSVNKVVDSSKKTDEGGIADNVEGAADKVIDPASSAVQMTTKEPVDKVVKEAKAVEDTADSVLPGDVELVDKVEKTTEQVTSGKAVDELVDAGGDLIENVEEKVYSAPIVGKAAKDVVDTTEPVVDKLLPAGGLERVTRNLQSSTSNVLEKEAVAKLNAISNPDLTEKEKEEIIEEAMSVRGVREWSPEGWRFVGMDFVGKEKSDRVEWERAIVYLYLPDGAGDPPQECFQGWSATIEVSLETMEAEDSGYPTKSSKCTSDIVLKDPVTEMFEGLSSLFAHQAGKASVNPSFVIAEAGDFTTNDVYGNTAYLKTPSYEPEIFDHMDRYIAHLLNQKWKTSPTEHMAQVGWLITTVEGCADCGAERIAENTGVLVFTDTSLFGNLEARRIPFEWKADENLLASTTCNDEANYLISVQYDSRVFNHNTNVPCKSADNDSGTSNSLFFENWNTVESSSWAQDITGKVEAHSASAFINSHEQLSHWTSSTNREQRCDNSRGSTTVISESLSGGKAASWAGLDQVPPAC